MSSEFTKMWQQLRNGTGTKANNPTKEVDLVWDSRKGILSDAVRAYGYYQTLYRYFPEPVGKGSGISWVMRRGNAWGEGWFAIDVSQVPKQVQLAVTLMS